MYSQPSVWCFDVCIFKNMVRESASPQRHHPKDVSRTTMWKILAYYFMDN